MKAFGVQIAGEKQLRKVSKEAIGENLAGEATPFYFSGKPGIDIQLAPHVFVPDLVSKIFQILDQNERYTPKHINTHLLSTQ